MTNLDEIIREIQETSSLSAECRNSLHACMSYHPWGRAKSHEQRKVDALYAISGRKTVNINLVTRLERAQ